VDLVSRGLDPDERDAVRGDLVESGDPGGRALYQVLGLVVRRQAAVWMHWRPWLILVLITGPLAIKFSVFSKWLAFQSAIYLWLYTNYWTPTILEEAAYRHDFFRFVFTTPLDYVVLAGGAWISGFLLAFISRRSLVGNGLLFGLLLFFSELLYVPGPSGRFIAAISRFPLFPGLPTPSLRPRYEMSVLGRNYLFRLLNSTQANAAVFAETFYRVFFPLLVQSILVMAPFLFGMRQGLRVVHRHNLLKENPQ